jgi:hypothetical protein
MYKKLVLLVLLCLWSTSNSFSQEANKQSVSTDSLQKSVNHLKKEIEILKRLKINGWIQAQYQVADSSGVDNLDGGKFPVNVDSRFMIRRGRFKLTYDHYNVQYVAQLNMTERFINIADIYAKYTEPYIKWFSFQIGVMNRPFGYDIQLSSQHRESPERARYTQVLTPNERDMGAEIIVEAPKTSKFHGLSFTSGFFNGTGLTIPAVNISDIDSKKDLISRLAYYNSYNQGKNKYGIGFSNYYGYERVATANLFDQITSNGTNEKQFVKSDNIKDNTGSYSKRIYSGFEGLYSFKSFFGTTTLRGEYVFGQQPGSKSSTRSPQDLTSGDTYLRKFDGFYAYFIQRIGESKHDVSVKYEWYDPNTKVSGNNISAVNNFSAADIKYSALGLTYIFNLNVNYKIMLNYNMVTNETTKNVAGYSKDLKDNIFTARFQIRF